MDVPTTSIMIHPNEWTDDEASKLGNANGNTHMRKPGNEIHDGQIMVRLKKKRFILIDYGYVPTQQDFEIAKAVAHVCIPKGAGTAACLEKGCDRVGVPVCLYDSEPHEPMSLYLRGGMCFTCQRTLNEKRRTQRKRKSDGLPVGEVRMKNASLTSSPGPFKFNGEAIDLHEDAVVINGAVDGTRRREAEYQYPQIGCDVMKFVNDLSHETNALVANQTGGAQPETINSLYQKAFLSVSKATFLLTQWKASYDEIHQSILSETEKPTPLPTGPAIHVPRSALHAPAIHQPSQSCFEEEEGMLEEFSPPMEMPMPPPPVDADNLKSEAQMPMPPPRVHIGNKSEVPNESKQTEQV